MVIKMIGLPESIITFVRLQQQYVILPTAKKKENH